MYQMESDFGPDMKRTSGHQRRSYNDLQYQMMYTYYVIESPHNYPYQLIDHRDHVGYCALTDDYFKNRYRIRKTRNERNLYEKEKQTPKKRNLKKDKIRDLLAIFNRRFGPTILVRSTP